MPVPESLKDIFSEPSLEVVYENDRLAVINKPPGLLSVPGRGADHKDCVQARVFDEFPTATGPITVHRLDMDTSGLIVVALNAKTHAALSLQFMERRVSKRYIAVLDGHVASDTGAVDLPLIVDWPNRPRQMVCHDTGKPAVTEYRVLERTTGDGRERTRIEFTPVTGRSHQLRVHAATLVALGGLGCPIAGDTLYGDPSTASRMLLHASVLAFTEPVTNESLRFQSDAPF